MWKNAKLPLNGSICFVLIFLFGCANPMELKHEYVDFAKNYGDANNQQLLLNLARLANNDPVNFLQLGSFSSQYQFMVGAGFSPSVVDNSPGFYHSGGNALNAGVPTMGTYIKKALTLGGTANTSFTQTPIFQYLPITGTNLVAALYNPITDKVFFTLYDQGFPADLLARIMVVAVARTNGSSPNSFQYFVNNPTDPTYPEFLIYCDKLRKAQRSRLLVIQKSKEDVIYSSNAVKAKDIIAAVQANLLVKSTNGLVVFSTPGHDYQLVPNLIPFSEDLSDLFEGKTNSIFVKNLQGKQLSTLSFTVDSQPPNFEKVKEFATSYETTFPNSPNTKTVESAMFTAAREEVYYRRLAAETNNPSKMIKFWEDKLGPIATVTRPDKSTFDVRPLMRLTCQGDELPPSQVTARVSYGDGHFKHYYYVGDQDGITQNRTVFTLLSYLFAQTAISTQNLPVQQLIKVQ